MDDNQCRVCLGEAKDYRLSVFKRVNGVAIEEKLQFVTGLQITKQDNFSKLLCTKCFNDTCTAYTLKLKCLDTDRTLKNLERKFQTKLKEKVQEIIQQNDFKGELLEYEELEPEQDVKQEMSDQLILEEVVDEEQVLEEEIYVTEEVDEEMIPAVSGETYEEVLEEYLEPEMAVFKIELDQTVETKHSKFVCVNCKPNVPFKYEIGLNCHNWDYHQIGANDPLVCATCSYLFDAETVTEELLNSQIRKHHRAHAAGKMYSCMLCPELLKSWRHVEMHRSRHHNVQKQSIVKIKCKGCHNDFLTNNELQAHLSSSSKCRDNHERPFKCYICNATFSMGIAKKKHIQTDHQDKAGADCPLCMRCKIPSAVAFENHYKTHFAQPRFTCSFCARPFYESDRLSTHIRRAHQNTKLSCNWCDKTFRDKSGIARHILGVHFNRRDHRCELCSKAFTESYNLKEHMFSVHKTASKYYSCESCSQVFLYRKQFERHRHSCSEQAPAPDKRRRR